MPELEYVLMSKTGQPYRICRQLVLDSRKTLGIEKYDPWTDNLHDAAMRLYVARFGHKTDVDSTTISSYSLDGSEEINHSHDNPRTVELVMLKEEEMENEPEQAAIGKKKEQKWKMKRMRIFGGLRRTFILRTMRGNGANRPVLT